RSSDRATPASVDVVDLRRVDRELLADVVDQVSDRLAVQRVDGDGRLLIAATRLVLREEAEALEPVHQTSLVRALDLRERDEELAALDLAEVLLLLLSDGCLRRLVVLGLLVVGHLCGPSNLCGPRVVRPPHRRPTEWTRRRAVITLPGRRCSQDRCPAPESRRRGLHERARSEPLPERARGRGVEDAPAERELHVLLEVER